MKLSVPVTLGLAALAAASPVAVVNDEVVAPSAMGKRCFLWNLFFRPRPKPCPPSQKPNPPKPTTTPCPTTSTQTPAPTPTGPETKREDQEDNLAQLFNFIDAASEEDVNQFIHFYKNADNADIEAWWSGANVTSEFAPSFAATKIYEIAQADVQDAST